MKRYLRSETRRKDHRVEDSPLFGPTKRGKLTNCRHSMHSNSHKNVTSLLLQTNKKTHYVQYEPPVTWHFGLNEKASISVDSTCTAIATRNLTFWLNLKIFFLEGGRRQALKSTQNFLLSIFTLMICSNQHKIIRESKPKLHYCESFFSVWVCFKVYICDMMESNQNFTLKQLHSAMFSSKVN